MDTLPALDLSWEAPEGCPDRARVVAEIERLTGRALSGESKSATITPRLSVKAVVTSSERGMSVIITSGTEGATHDRKVEAPTCKEVADATVLIVAMALDSGLAPPNSAPGTPLSPANSGDPGDPAGLGAEHKKKAPPERANDPASSANRGARDTGSAPATIPRSIAIRGEGRVMFAFDAAALPSPAPGLAGALGLWFGSFRIDALGAVFPEQRKTLGGGGGGDVGLGTGALTVWLVPLRAPLDVLVGVGIEAGAIWGHGVGVEGARSGTAPWIAARAGVGAAYSFTPRLGVSLDASLVVPLVRQRFLFGNDELFVPAPASLRLETGFFVRLP